jgi:phospholipid/cholesterol/gamma-HCH transport system permease protein
MPASEARPNAAVRALEGIGRSSTRGFEAVGFGATLFWDSLWWLALGRRHGQVVHAGPVFSEMMAIGIHALPIVTLLSTTIGLMLALQGIYSLRQFGAEAQVVLGLAQGITREFAPLITGILVAGRSGSALAARLGTMTISNEIDALRVMGVNPVRFLVVPSLLALVVMLPCLVLWSELVALGAAGLYVAGELGTTFGGYVQDVNRAIDVGDLLHGLSKSGIFAVLITLVGIVDGSAVKGGAEGVGRVTTNAVVHGITAIVFTDMLFVFATTR